MSDIYRHTEDGGVQAFCKAHTNTANTATLRRGPRYPLLQKRGRARRGEATGPRSHGQCALEPASAPADRVAGCHEAQGAESQNELVIISRESWSPWGNPVLPERLGCRSGGELVSISRRRLGLCGSCYDNRFAYNYRTGW